MVPVDSLQEHILRVLVGDVSDHDCRASVFTVQDTMQVDGELRIVILTSLLS